MACDTKTWLVLPFLLLAVSYMQHPVHSESQVPCLFIFGDSVSDSGNNNNLPTSSKANYKPYGIDFPTGSSGRFTNGPTAIDIISLSTETDGVSLAPCPAVVPWFLPWLPHLALLLGFEKFIPPFSNTVGSDILKGVNYASGSAGILYKSGKQMGANFDLGQQLANHRTIVSEIAKKLGGFQQAEQYLNKCLYYVNIGSNDYINNYFLPQFYPTSRTYSPEQYAELLIHQLSKYIQALHDVGARKYVLVGLGLLGCTPNAISTHGTNGSCVEEMNADALIFSDKLKSLVDQLNSQFVADSKFIFINSTTAGSLDSSLGFTVSNVPCCPTLKENGLCIPDQMPCLNGNEYVFWDGFHTTSAVNQLTAITSYNSSSNPASAYPTDIKHLVQS